MTPLGSGPAKSLGEAHRYRLDKRIATGGMGEVWRATDTVLGREVAVKVLKNEYADDPLFRSRFEAEARHAAALHHPGVASVFDFGEVPSDDAPDNEGQHATRPFLVMELVLGQPLSALLRGNKPMPPETAADLVAQAADAIAAAHALGIVHRDVKPANLLVTPKGIVKITDFGIARAASGLALTNTGEVIGTPNYISPEQAEGKPATAASDIYCLGVVLYECLAGRRPFAADSPVATALAHLREPVPPLSDDVPEHMQQVTMKALAKDPADRFASAADLAGALRGGLMEAGAAGAAAGSHETKVMAAVPAAVGAGATAVGASVGPSSHDGEDGTGPKRRRSLAAYWPVAAAAAAVLLVIALVSVFTDGSGEDNPSGDNKQQPTQQSSDVEPRDDRVPVSEAEYVGMDADLAKQKLEALGFGVNEVKTANPGANPEGTVASVTPNGLVEPDREITLSAWDSAPEPEEDESPSSSPSSSSSSPSPSQSPSPSPPPPSPPEASDGGSSDESTPEDPPRDSGGQKDDKSKGKSKGSQ